MLKVFCHSRITADQEVEGKTTLIADCLQIQGSHNICDLKEHEGRKYQTTMGEEEQGNCLQFR